MTERDGFEDFDGEFFGELENEIDGEIDAVDLPRDELGMFLSMIASAVLESASGMIDAGLKLKMLHGEIEMYREKLKLMSGEAAFLEELLDSPVVTGNRAVLNKIGDRLMALVDESGAVRAQLAIAVGQVERVKKEIDESELQHSEMLIEQIKLAVDWAREHGVVRLSKEGKEWGVSDDH